MRGVWIKIYWETRWPVLLFGVGLAIVMGLLTALLPRVLGDIHLVFEKLPFVKPLVTALLGVDPGEQLSAAMSQAFLWVHPTVLSIIWAHEVMYCTRMPASEIDRATIDFLLGLPISRWQLFLSESLGWLVSGICILGCGFLGHWIVGQFTGAEMHPSWVSTAFVMINLLAVYIAVGALCLLISAISDRRNRAIGVVFAILLFSFLINFLAQFWDPLGGVSTQGNRAATAVRKMVKPDSAGTKSPQPNSDEPLGRNDQSSSPAKSQRATSSWSIASVSLMHYYRPAMVIQSGKFPRKDVAILLGFGFVCWLSAGIHFSRRSICTV